MGSGSSVPNGKEATEHMPQKSVRGLFEKEFRPFIVKCNESETCSSIIINNNDNITETNATATTDKAVINPTLFKAKRLFMKPLALKRPKQDNLVVKKQDNGALLKEIFRRMATTVTSLSSQVIVGQIELAVKYKILEKSLLVKINRAKDLEKDGIGMPDPYVSVELFSLRNPSNACTWKTAIRSNSVNPVFQEIFTFPLEEKSIPNSKLKVSVWDKDDFLGEKVIDLCQLDLNAGNMMWYKLHPRLDDTICGSIDATINIETPNKLIISVHQAYDIKACNGDRSNPYVRLYVTGIPTKEETKVISSTRNPEWNDSFDFTVHSDEFSRRIVILNVLSKEDHGSRDKRLGDVHISLADFDVAHFGLRRNYLLQDLRNTPYTRSKWSEEGVSMEFKEAMKAHAIYGYPKFIYKKLHKGKMVVSCRSVNARAEARVIINNGVLCSDAIQM